MTRMEAFKASLSSTACSEGLAYLAKFRTPESCIRAALATPPLRLDSTWWCYTPRGYVAWLFLNYTYYHKGWVDQYNSILCGDVSFEELKPWILPCP